MKSYEDSGNLLLIFISQKYKKMTTNTNKNTARPPGYLYKFYSYCLLLICIET